MCFCLANQCPSGIYQKIYLIPKLAVLRSGVYYESLTVINLCTVTFGIRTMRPGMAIITVHAVDPYW